MEHTKWPALADFRVFPGRAATEEDVAGDSAVFVLCENGEPIGRPLDVELPQYAYHLDGETGTQTPCVVQAEEARGQRIVGGWLLPGRTKIAGLYGDFVLLGTGHPPAGAPAPESAS